MMKPKPPSARMPSQRNSSCVTLPSGAAWSLVIGERISRFAAGGPRAKVRGSKRRAVLKAGDRSEAVQPRDKPRVDLARLLLLGPVAAAREDVGAAQVGKLGLHQRDEVGAAEH